MRSVGSYLGHVLACFAHSCPQQLEHIAMFIAQLLNELTESFFFFKIIQKRD